MKKIVSSLIITSGLLFADGLYSKKEVIPEINLNNQMILKTSMENYLISTDIYGNNFLVNDKKKIKIFNINSRELIKTIPAEKIYKVQASGDNSKIIALSEKEIFIINSKNYKILSSIKGDFLYFIESKNILVTFNNHTDINDVYNLNNGKKLVSIPKDNIENGAISPNLKKIALTNGYKIFIYNLNGNLLNTISLNQNSIKEIKWANNNSIFVLYNKKVMKYDVITSQKIAETPKLQGYYSKLFSTINENNVLIANQNEAFIYNFNAKKIVKKYNLSEKYNIKSLKLKNNYLSVGYEKNAYLYKIDINKKVQPTDIKLSKNSNQEKTITKIVEKKVYIHDKVTGNIKPTLEVYASQTEGLIPLTVNFKILANDEDGKIASYYINFAGKEIIHKGNPSKSFNYTFNKVGKYKIMVAVKDNKGAITSKKITIQAKEESFNDYKKTMLGN